MTRLIGITGGIGSGKSMVSEILTVLSFDVYDCDSRAKVIMDGSDEIKKIIRNKIGEDCILEDGAIDRRRLSSIVFGDPDKLKILNKAVHSAVRADILNWADDVKGERAWVESAILYESGIDRMVDEVWEVIAPDEIRVLRVMNRSALSAEEVISRMEAQKKADGFIPHPVTHIIENDGVHPLLSRILGLLA